MRLLSTAVAERVVAAAERVRSALPAKTASVVTDEIIDALRQGRVETLLVHDDGDSDHQSDVTWLDGAPLVDRAIATAIATDADIIVVPALSMMTGPLAATMRW